MELNHIQDGVIGRTNLVNIHHEGWHNWHIHLNGVKWIRILFQQTKRNAKPTEQIAVVQNRTMRAWRITVSVGKTQTIQILSNILDEDLDIRIASLILADKPDRNS